VNSSLEERDAAGADVPLFEWTYEEHHRSLYAYLLGRSGNSDVAADLLQETFLRVWRHMESLRQVPAQRRRFWLFAVARNVVNDHYRRVVPRQEREESMSEGIALRSATAGPEAMLEASETAAIVDAAIERLPDNLRTVLAMRLLTGMTSTEIGEALGRPAGTVRYQLAEARQRIAVELGLQDNSDARERIGKR